LHEIRDRRHAAESRLTCCVGEAARLRDEQHSAGAAHAIHPFTRRLPDRDQCMPLGFAQSTKGFVLGSCHRLLYFDPVNLLSLSLLLFYLFAA